MRFVRISTFGVVFRHLGVFVLHRPGVRMAVAVLDSDGVMGVSLDRPADRKVALNMALSCCLNGVS